MLNLILITENERERNILTIAFKQSGFNVMHSDATYKNYIFVLQYMPDIIVIEIPYYCVEQLSFTERIKAFGRTKGIPIIGYGDKVSQSILNGMIKKGVSVFIQRPLKFNNLLKHIEYYLKLQKKTLEVKPDVTEKEKDIALLLNVDTPPGQKIELMVGHVSKLLAFPFTVTKVLHVTQDEKTGAQQLAKVVNTDPNISTYILKIANSVFFATANKPISSIKDAIVRIGFNETKRIVLGMSIMNLFDAKNKNSGFDRIDFWYHSLATAITAERIAKNIQDVDLAEVFLAGLLHDLGILFLDDFFPSVFDTILTSTAKEAGLFYEHEKNILNFSHLDLIGELFPKWRIPQNITDAIIGQYEVTDVQEQIDSPSKKIAACVAIGNATAKLLHIGKECDEFVVPFDNGIFKQAKLPLGLSSAVIEYIHQQVTLFSQFLNLEKREFRCDCPTGIKTSDIAIGLCNHGGSFFLPPEIFCKIREIHFSTFLPDSDFEKLNGKYHIIICWTTSSIDSDLMDRLQHIQKNPSITHSGNTVQGQFAPLIIFAPEQEHGGMTAGNDCWLLNNKIDYRSLESRIFTLLSPS